MADQRIDPDVAAQAEQAGVTYTTRTLYVVLTDSGEEVGRQEDRGVAEAERDRLNGETLAGGIVHRGELVRHRVEEVYVIATDVEGDGNADLDGPVVSSELLTVDELDRADHRPPDTSTTG